MTSIVLPLALAALPAAPTQVRYVTAKGDVTFDHAAHVARREPCRTCHGTGQVQKVALGKQRAHVLCVGCHAAAKVGPKACWHCHA